jgi:phage tail sheath protein FI
MPTSYLTPGVYFEPPDAAPVATSSLRTDIAAFVGYAERGPLHTPVWVESFRQFQATFGDFAAPAYLPLSVRGFFDNGGRTCYIVRVADRTTAAPAAATSLTRLGKPGWTIEASSPGQWGNQLAVRLRQTRLSTTVSLPDPTGDRRSTRVVALARFEPGTLARITQGLNTVFLVLLDVDGERQRLTWDADLPPAIDLNRPFDVESVAFTLSVFRDGRLSDLYENLSVVPSHPRYAPLLLAGPKPDSRVRDKASAAPPPPVIVLSVNKITKDDDLPAPPSPKPSPLRGGADGLASVRVADITGSAEDDLDTEPAGAARLRGLRALENVNDVSLVAVPDIVFTPPGPIRYAPRPKSSGPVDPCACPPVAATDVDPPKPAAPEPPELPPTFRDDEVYRVQAALLAHCEMMHDRFGLLDTPADIVREKNGMQAVLSWRSRFDSTFGALFYPWIRTIHPVTGRVLEMPPSGHIAGLYARTDLEVGVHKAPANATLLGVVAPTIEVGDAEQGLLNPRGVNAIRTFPGRGVRLYGARTVSSDPDWKFVNVRRLLLMIEKAADLASRWAVFEPNSFETRNRLRLVLETFLESLWRGGALAGTQPEEAFFVRCDDTTTPAQTRDNGQLLAIVGVAPAIPGEFVIVRIGRTQGEVSSTVE